MTLAYLYLVIHAPPARYGAAGVLPCLWMSQSVKELFFQLAHGSVLPKSECKGRDFTGYGKLIRGFFWKKVYDVEEWEDEKKERRTLLYII